MTQNDPRVEAAATAFLYGIAPYEVARTRAAALASGQPENTFRHIRALTDAKDRWVTTPNVDTLYSIAWINLADGPVEIDLPASADRYVSLALMDAFSDNFAVLHPQDAGAPRFIIAGPRGTATAGTATAGGATPGGGRTLLRSPTDTVWALARTYVAGEADLAGAHRVQDAFRIAGPAPGRGTDGPVDPGLRGDASAVFGGIAALVRANPRPDEDAAVSAALSSLERAPAEVLDAGRATAWQRMRVRGDQPRTEGWLYPKDHLGDFGRDYLFRAQVAIGGLAALPVREAMYLRAMTGDSAMFRGGAWRLRVGPDAVPPLRDFWSLTLYEPDGSGALFFYDTPERVYAIKNLDPGFRSSADGGFEIVVAQERPADPNVNWLPAPAGPFALIFRAYGPAPAMMDRRYRLPPLVPA